MQLFFDCASEIRPILMSVRPECLSHQPLRNALPSSQSFPEGEEAVHNPSLNYFSTLTGSSRSPAPLPFGLFSFSVAKLSAVISWIARCSSCQFTGLVMW